MSGRFRVAWSRAALAIAPRVRPGAPPHTLRVLVVDDEDYLRRFVHRVLTEAGMTVWVASDGAEALQLASRVGDFDLLLTDLMMPGMNGDELARRLRSHEPDLEVLYLTGFSDLLFAERMQLWENEAFLDKPCSARGLLEAVSLMTEGTCESIHQRPWHPGALGAAAGG